MWHDADEKRINQEIEEGLFVSAQDAIKEGNEEEVMKIITKLDEEGYKFSAQMIKKEWEDSQEVDV